MHQYKGKLIVHTGSMFSGKTSSLKKDLNRFKIAGYKTMAYKPIIDTREEGNITVHNESSMAATNIATIQDIIKDVYDKQYQVIGIDEVQFLAGKMTDIREGILELLSKGITVVTAGLDMDYNGVAFEVIKELMPIADYVNKHHAVCTMCGVDAWVSHRKVTDEERVLIGAETEYEPLCRTCYNKVREEERREVNKNQIKFELAE